MFCSDNPRNILHHQVIIAFRHKIFGSDVVTRKKLFRFCVFQFRCDGTGNFPAGKINIEHNIGIIFGIFSAVVLTAYLLELGVIRVNKFLSDGSFCLYALHASLMLVLARCITKVFFVDSLFYTVALYFIVPCLTTAVSFGLYELLRRYTPRICAVLTGGR